ncbi:hypothetical protein HJFPF1_04359 [Paramyrothecium foliicola]|nr:hypothetical protein HJFPF1_04359 [Paramyrothecium foliicola]
MEPRTPKFGDQKHHNVGERKPSSKIGDRNSPLAVDLKPSPRGGELGTSKAGPTSPAPKFFLPQSGDTSRPPPSSSEQKPGPQSEAACRFFELGKNKSCHTNDFRNNADIDQVGITNFAAQFFGKNAKVVPDDPFVNEHGFRVKYFIVPGFSSEPKYFTLVIEGHKDAATAQAGLGAMLDLFDIDLDAVIRKSPQPLGQVSLEMSGQLAWTRDSLLIIIEPKYSDFFEQPRARRMIPYRIPIETSANQLVSAANKKSPHEFVSNLPELLFKFAAKFDHYIAEGAAPLEKQRQPDITLDHPSPIIVPPGRFTLKLKNPDDTCAHKPADSRNMDRLMYMGNGYSTDGYEFEAFLPGTTEVKLVVAHAKSFAIKKAYVTVHVS